MNLVVLPTQALRNPNIPPFFLRQQPKSRLICIPIVLRYYLHLEELLWQNDMTILVYIVAVLVRVMDPKEEDTG